MKINSKLRAMFVCVCVCLCVVADKFLFAFFGWCYLPLQLQLLQVGSTISYMSTAPSLSLSINVLILVLICGISKGHSRMGAKGGRGWQCNERVWKFHLLLFLQKISPTWWHNKMQQQQQQQQLQQQLQTQTTRSGSARTFNPLWYHCALVTDSLQFTVNSEDLLELEVRCFS